MALDATRRGQARRNDQDRAEVLGAVKRLIRRVTPTGVLGQIRHLRDAILPSRRRWSSLLGELRRSGQVQTGPFAGLDYGPDAAFGSPIPFLIGSYEEELHPAIHRAFGEGYERVVDVGSAEGYYAIGFARRLESAEVFAYDIDPNAQAMCRSMADRNGVAERVHVGGACLAEDLDRLIVGRTLVISDCEGFEVELLDPRRAPALADADMLVELHDFIDPSISRTICDRFGATHDIEMIDARQRSAVDYPALADLPAHLQRQTLDEGRPLEPHPMQWAAMWSLAHASPSS